MKSLHKLIAVLLIVGVLINAYFTREFRMATKAEIHHLEGTVAHQTKLINRLQGRVDTQSEMTQIMTNEFNHAQDLLDRSLDELEKRPRRKPLNFATSTTGIGVFGYSTPKPLYPELKEVDADEPTVPGINQ